MNTEIKENIRETVFTVDETLCTGCGKCLEACGMKVLEIQDGRCVMVKSLLCLECGMCLRACPEDAIRIEGLDETGIVKHK